MIYIGDGLTDVSCMKPVKVNGGQSIAVYNPGQGKEIAQKPIKNGRVNFCVPADYSEGSDLEAIVSAIMNKIKAVSEMESYAD